MGKLREFIEKINIRAFVAENEPMSAHCTFRIGGPADLYVEPEAPEDLAVLLRACRDAGLPCFVLGGGANVLIGDKGIRGVVASTTRLSEARAAEGPGGPVLRAMAGCRMEALCELAWREGLSGLEFIYGMPGSLGGSVYMNARCYDREMAELLASIDYLDGDLAPGRLVPGPGDFAYKASPFQPGGRAAGGVVLGAELALARGDKGKIRSVMDGRRADREAKGHYRYPCAGSIFKNDRRLGRPSGKVLDELGMRGFRRGGAMVSDFHANIFVNAGGASAADMRALIEAARDRARTMLGIELEPEVLFVGDF